MQARPDALGIKVTAAVTTRGISKIPIFSGIVLLGLLTRGGHINVRLLH